MGVGVLMCAVFRVFEVKCHWFYGWILMCLEIEVRNDREVTLVEDYPAKRF